MNLSKNQQEQNKYTFGSTEELLEFLNEELLSAAEATEVLEISKARLGQLVKDGKLIAAKEQPKMFLKSVLLEKKDELESLRKKYRPYDE
ncbi:MULTISPECIES: DNA-binding protein [unclassified Lysinibacillus]|uniref:DNA-binding protein n=1 Tax=unclassified Lysinibacillus TaxID=2636778 RepID=UPI003808490D